MRFTFGWAVLLVASVALATEKTPAGTGIIDGTKVVFPEKSLAEGEKAVSGLLQSCHDESLFRAEELEKARKGDHIRLTFPKPIKATVMNETIEFSEVVFRLPMNTGVFWVRSGEKWRRFSKYEFQKEKPFTTWLRQAKAEK